MGRLKLESCYSVNRLVSSPNVYKQIALNKQVSSLNLGQSHSNFSLPPSSSPITPPCKSVDLKMEGRWLHKEDRWKDRALCLQHRLRDRFRVVVDQHRRRQKSSGYVSSVMQRWIQRFRHFRSQTLANSSTFYRKRGFCFFLC